MQNSNQKLPNEQNISRYQLKQQLSGMLKVDISSFAQSKNQMSKYSPIDSQNSNIFPIVDAPTLQFQFNNESQKKVKKTQPDNNKRKYYEDPTQRAKKQQNPKRRQLQLQAEIQFLTSKLNEKDTININLREQNQILKDKIKTNELASRKKQQSSKNQRQQIVMLKQREIMLTKQKQQILRQFNNLSNTNNNSVSSYIEDVSSFCPQMLSPQETVLLLSKLLKKVSKSSKMIRQLAQEGSVKQILGKMSKR